MIFDIVIPVGPNDAHVIQTMIEFTRKNVIGYRNIYLVVFDPTIVVDDRCIIIDEKIFPFTIATLLVALGGTTDTSRVGWYLQQLIKLYAGKVIDGILNEYLVVDADTYFLRPTTFFDESTGVPLYNVGTEYHPPYFEHMQKLHPYLTKKTQYSGICHHMVFQTDRICELFRMVEAAHIDDDGDGTITIRPFHEIFMRNVSPQHRVASGASEYEIYFNFLLDQYPDKFKIRVLPWKNTNVLNVNDTSVNYVSYHWYLR